MSHSLVCELFSCLPLNFVSFINDCINYWLFSVGYSISLKLKTSCRPWYCSTFWFPIGRTRKKNSSSNKEFIKINLIVHRNDYARKKCLFGLCFHITVHQRRKSGLELRAGTWGRNSSRSHGGTLITGLHHKVSSICFLIHHRIICPGLALLTIGWTLPY